MMVNLLDSAVMTGLMSASSHSKRNQLCTGLYHTAASRGDEGAADRAMGYAGESRNKAASAVEQTREALTQRIQEVRAEEQLEREQRLEQSRLEQQVRAEAIQEANTASLSEAGGAAQPAAVLELSPAYWNNVQTGSAAEAGKPKPAPEAAVSTPQPPKSVSSIQPAAAGAAGGRRFFMDIRV